MKKLLVLLALLSFTTVSTIGQIRIGPKAGYNKSITTLVQSGTETNYNSGYQFGISMMFGDKVYFQPEILYSQKGMRVDSLNDDDCFIYKNSYLQVPLMLNFGVGENKFRAFVNFGPYIGYWTNGKVRTTIDGHTISSDYIFDDDLEDGLRDHRWDYGFSGGGGLGLRLGIGWLYLEARYDYGFDDIRTATDVDVSYQSVRNRTISGTLSYLIQF